MEFFDSIPAGGSVFNAAAVVIGGAIGVLLGRLIPKKTFLIVFQCLGLFCFYIGFSMAGKTQNSIIVLLSLVIGAAIGDVCDLDRKLNDFGEWLKNKLGSSEGSFTEGFVTVTLLACIGSMSVLGALEEGLGGPPNLLITKGIMDGTAAIAFGASMGVGVMFAGLPLLIYQGGITLAAEWAQKMITPVMLDNLSGIGGIMVLAIGLNLLKIVEVKTGNLLPGLLLVLLLTALV